MNSRAIRAEEDHPPVPVCGPTRQEMPMTESAGPVIDLQLTPAHTLEQAVGEALGAASMCWETPEGAGVFDSSAASGIADQLVAWIRSRDVPAVSLTATQQAAINETLAAITTAFDAVRKVATANAAGTLAVTSVLLTSMQRGVTGAADARSQVELITPVADTGENHAEGAPGAS
jgi:hypothetical protein